MLSGSFFFQMMVCAVFIAVVLSSLDEQINKFAVEVLVVNLFSLLLELLLNYFSCAYAQEVTTHAAELAEMAYTSQWYRLSMEQQRIVQFIIFRAQEPFYLNGYQIFMCSMATFLAVNFFWFAWLNLSCCMVHVLK